MADKKFYVSEEDLRSSYEVLQSMEKVASKFGVSKKLILNYMNKFGIKRKSSKKDQRTKQIMWLAGQKKKSTEIAEEVGVSVSLVNRYLKELGVKPVRYHKGFTETDSGYILCRCPDHPNADSKGYVREHVLVVTKVLGRPLKDNEVVHHKDEDKANNLLSNLQVMDSAEHKSLHSRRPRKRKCLV
jgi:transposase